MSAKNGTNVDAVFTELVRSALQERQRKMLGEKKSTKSSSWFSRKDGPRIELPPILPSHMLPAHFNAAQVKQRAQAVELTGISLFSLNQL